MRSGKLERCFLVKGMTDETKQFFISDFIQRVALESSEKSTPKKAEISDVQEILDEESVKGRDTSRNDNGSNDKPENSSSAQNSEEPSSDQSVVSPDVAQQLLDISLLEFVSKNMLKEAVDLLLSEARNQVLPSMASLKALVSLLEESEDLTHLDSLYRCIPIQCPQRDIIYVSMGTLRLKPIAKNLQAGRKLLSWVKLIEFYRKTWADKNNGVVSDKHSDALLNICLKHLKLVIEEVMISDQELKETQDMIKAIKVGVGRIVTEYGDGSPIGLLWESMFFSSSWDHQEEASKVIEQMPSLLGALDIDKLLARAVRYKEEEIFRKIVELCLKYDAPSYHKSRAFEEVLAYQTRSDNVLGGNHTIQTAKSLDIRISADYMQEFMELKKEIEGSLSRSLLHRAKNIFNKTPKY